MYIYVCVYTYIFSFYIKTLDEHLFIISHHKHNEKINISNRIKLICIDLCNYFIKKSLHLIFSIGSCLRFKYYVLKF